MQKGPSTKTIMEPEREVTVFREADVVVVGAGPGGHAAAIAAARNGADTILVERYGHLGGMATGGLVTILPNMCDIYGVQQIVGQTQEWIDRMENRDGVDYPKREDWASTNRAIVKYYKNRSFFYVRQERVVYSVLFDAEILKCALNDMAEEAGVKTLLHSWGTEAIVDGDNEVQGVIFESKSGRQAILAKVIIDGTGDGDLLPSAGATFDMDIDPTLRIANLSLCYWIGGVDLKKVEEFRQTQPEKDEEQMQELIKIGGHPNFFKSNLKNQESVVWIHPRYTNSSQIDVEELTRVEFEGRKRMLITYDYRKKNTPGFENAFITLTSPQLGTRSSRRIHGEYMVTEKDIVADRVFDDTIAIFPDLDRGEESARHPNIHIPYRSLIPRSVENLLVACRAFSSDQLVQNFFNLIPHCIAFGEAAGTAAALCVKDGSRVRDVDQGALRERLIKQGVPLPEVK
ncbi:MAG: FAD-dependent oxidoreductase [Deltaproteobacteria bacterium]|nr:FAD-dependent oxidoreductase [Deltaproteobacteria bacterium]